jgi:transposase
MTMAKTVGRKAKTELININELKEWIQKDINRLSGVKCQALISLKNNVSVKDICKVLGVTRESIRLWRKTIETEGPEGFIKHQKPGRNSGLTKEIEISLKKALSLNPENCGYMQAIWDGKLVCKFLLENKGITISVRTAQYWLKEIGLTRQRPRKKYKQTDEAEIEAFKKTSKRRKLN